MGDSNEKNIYTMVYIHTPPKKKKKKKKKKRKKQQQHNGSFHFIALSLQELHGRILWIISH